MSNSTKTNTSKTFGVWIGFIDVGGTKYLLILQDASAVRVQGGI